MARAQNEECSVKTALGCGPLRELCEFFSLTPSDTAQALNTRRPRWKADSDDVASRATWLEHWFALRPLITGLRWKEDYTALFERVFDALGRTIHSVSYGPLRFLTDASRLSVLSR